MAVTQNWDWKKFNPRVRQTDKREREGLVIKGRKMVEKNLFELGTSSLVCVPEVNLDRTFKKINHIFHQILPLKDSSTTGATGPSLEVLTKLLRTHSYGL